MAIVATNGGLIPWQSGIETSFGRFQFVLGREISVYFFGRTKEKDALINFAHDKSGNIEAVIIDYRSTQFEFPILEYRPFRSFAFDQSSTLMIQFYGGFDIPHNIKVLDAPDVKTPEFKTIWYLGARIVFDWRHYL